MRTCRPHLAGVAPNARPFFDPDCARCQEKLAAGLVTGKEPAPTKVDAGWRNRTKVSPERFKAHWDRFHAAKKAARVRAGGFF